MDFILSTLGKKLLAKGLLEPKPVQLLAAMVDGSDGADNLQPLMDPIYIGKANVTPLTDGGELTFEVPIGVGDFWMDGIFFLTPAKEVVGFQSLPRVYKSKSTQAHVFRTKIKVDRGHCANEVTLEKPASAFYSTHSDEKVASNELENLSEAFILSSENITQFMLGNDDQADQGAKASVLNASKALNENWGSELLKTVSNTLFNLRATLSGQAETANNAILQQKLVELVQALKWQEVGAEICPIGVILPWPQKPPKGWAICQGQSFSKSQYPSLAKVLPGGRLPDLRSMVVKGANASRTPLSYEGDEVKSHNHQANISPARLKANLKAAGKHRHSVADWGYRDRGTDTGHTHDYRKPRIVNFTTYDSSSDGQHSHTVHVGSHTHKFTLFDLDPAENRVKSLGFHYAIRMQ